jgi:hypothetical protein
MSHKNNTVTKTLQMSTSHSCTSHRSRVECAPAWHSCASRTHRQLCSSEDSISSVIDDNTGTHNYSTRHSGHGHTASYTTHSAMAQAHTHRW